MWPKQRFTNGRQRAAAVNRWTPELRQYLSMGDAQCFPKLAVA
jgi:hypothetical protein